MQICLVLFLSLTQFSPNYSHTIVMEVFREDFSCDSFPITRPEIIYMHRNAGGQQKRHVSGSGN